MTVMSSMNETALAPGTGRLALNSFRIFSEPALYQSGPGLHPSCTPHANPNTSEPPSSSVNRYFGGSVRTSLMRRGCCGIANGGFILWYAGGEGTSTVL